MYYSIIFILTKILLVKCDNETDVVVKYGGHSDLDRGYPSHFVDDHPVVTDHVTTAWHEEDVLFVPNEKPILRNENTLYDMKMDAVTTARIINEVASQDTIFISGKNNENVEKEIKQVQEKHADVIVTGRQTHRAIRKGKEKILDCRNLICNNTVNSVCGSRKEDGRQKYRLFMNDCYFRKVNCGFRSEVNRYTTVSMDECRKLVASGGSQSYHQPYHQPPQPELDHGGVKNDTRRSFGSRRSQSMGIDGQSCSHSCPVTCTDEYDPQCALSSGGHRKVFLNHCKLDQHSCAHEAVWYRRPLSECVGGKKADMQQNRGFIGWLQRVGILDRKGRLVLS